MVGTATTTGESVHTITTPDDARLHVAVSGPDNASVTVILAHGWTLSSQTWRRQAAALTASEGRLPQPVRVIRWDQRGHGRSTLGRKRPSIELLGADLALLIERLAPHGPLILAGHSMGGMTIMALTADQPDLVARRVTGVAFVATSGGHLDTRLSGYPISARISGLAQWRLMRSLSRRPELADRLRRLAPPELRAHQAAVRNLLFGPAASPEVVRECAELIHATPAHVIAAFHQPLVAHDKIWRLRPLRDKPVSILVGERDRLTSPRHSHALARALPEAELVVLPDRGHMLPLEVPEVINRRLATLCARAMGAAS